MAYKGRNYGDAASREYGKFAGTGKGDWAPDHGGARYRVKTRNGTVELYDSDLKINKKTGLPRGMKGAKTLKKELQPGGSLHWLVRDD